MSSKLIKFIIGLSLGIVVALMIAFNALLIWVATGPRSLAALSPYIESAFAPEGSPWSVKIGETWLIWDGWRHPIDIRLRNIALVTQDGTTFSSFPEISMGIDVLSLAIGKVLPTSVTLTHPIISLLQNEDRSISFGMSGDQNKAESAATATTAPFALALENIITTSNTGSLRKLRFINIKKADISIGNVAKGVFFKADSTDIILSHNAEGLLRAYVKSTAHYGDYNSPITGEFSLKPEETRIDGKLDFSELMPGVLASLFYNDENVKAIHMPISGEVLLGVDRGGILQDVDFAVDGGVGTFTTDQLEDPLKITSLHGEGHWDQQDAQLTLRKFSIDTDGILIAAAGTVTLQGKDSSASGDVIIQHARARQIHMLWPPTLSPQTRQWVTTNITEGLISEAKAHLAIAPGDLAKPNLPKEAVDANIALEAASIRYLPGHPEVTHVKGTVHIDALTLGADIAAADYMKETKLSSGTVAIDDLNADNPYIKVALDIDSTAHDAARFLDLPKLKHAQRLGLLENEIAGTVKGRASVGFNFFATPNSDVTFDFKGEVKDISQNGFLHKFDIKSASGAVAVNNSELTYQGAGEVNGANVSSSNIKYLFHPQNGFDTFIDVKATAPVESLPRFGYPAFAFLKGSLGIDANLKQGDVLQNADAKIDLTNAKVDLDNFNWHKPDKEPASIAFTAENKDGPTHIPTFHLKGKNADVHGSASLNKELTDFQTVTLDKVLLGATNLAKVDYEILPGGYKIEAQGASADISGFLDKSGGDFSFEHFPVTQFKADIGKLLLTKGGVISNFKGDVTCDIKICSSANINGTSEPGGKPLSLRILRNPKGQRQLSLHAQDAGAFFRIFDIMQGLQGGDLSVTGNYDDSEGSSKLTARMDVTEYTVKDAPVLGKILSLASLTGFFDTLQGNGIRFTKLSAPFTIYKDVLTIDNAKTFGPAIGMTAEGTITFPKTLLDIRGTVVPSYTLNSVLGKVPLVGTLLTGGEGGGVFAARYSVQGTESKPDVSVNPLSMLTPGFLRGLFDVFDTKPEVVEDQ